jgi:nicotinamide mononucleotide transporter
VTLLELGANSVNALSILLAGRNSVHTWWTGIAGCVLFGWVFFEAKLYADVTLQVFFVGTSVAGWRIWRRGNAGAALPIRRTGRTGLAAAIAAALAIAIGYGWLLHRFTDAWNPFVDSLVLTSSVVAQLLLMKRRFESWLFWLFVNTLCVPLFWSRGLQLTSVLYALFWLNALVSIFHWRRLLSAAPVPAAA